MYNITCSTGMITFHSRIGHSFLFESINNECPEGYYRESSHLTVNDLCCPIPYSSQLYLAKNITPIGWPSFTKCKENSDCKGGFCDDVVNPSFQNVNYVFAIDNVDRSFFTTSLKFCFEIPNEIKGTLDIQLNPDSGLKLCSSSRDCNDKTEFCHEPFLADFREIDEVFINLRKGVCAKKRDLCKPSQGGIVGPFGQLTAGYTFCDTDADCVSDGRDPNLAKHNAVYAQSY
ncbi:unnamed protein product [Caenorhabditis bovis]|uniref:Uncharacterized protein n=1 Tax=Caenorhabditis bovis TaxID=2654633 RepID=A0A8S1F6F5_9PELO|nr:unnamed protein product [Caenorhabditis bovis]